MVLDFTSGRLVTSPYDLLTGSYWNSSGTMQIQIKRMQLNFTHEKKKEKTQMKTMHFEIKTYAHLF